MTRRGLMLAGIALGVAGCESRLNPLNWFGSAREERVRVVATEETGAPADPRPLVAQVLGLSVEPLPAGGAIVTARGLAPRQGYWEPALVETSREDGRLTYAFRVLPPPGPTPAGPAPSRELVVAAELSLQDLAQIRQIAVEGASNRLVSGR